MRIIIDIDEAGVTTTTVDPSARETRHVAAALPPAELLQRAEKLGAKSAGPAPAGPPAGTAAHVWAVPQPPSRERGAPAVLDVDAGQAPPAAAAAGTGEPKSASKRARKRRG
jgi:hypothetical protein